MEAGKDLLIKDNTLNNSRGSRGVLDPEAGIGDMGSVIRTGPPTMTDLTVGRATVGIILPAFSTTAYQQTHYLPPHSANLPPHSAYPCQLLQQRYQHLELWVPNPQPCSHRELHWERVQDLLLILPVWPQKQLGEWVHSSVEAAPAWDERAPQ